jgi:hypothetical protein
MPYFLQHKIITQHTITSQYQVGITPVINKNTSKNIRYIFAAPKNNLLNYIIAQYLYKMGIICN